MATSTEDTVRAVIVAAIEGIATTSLGFDRVGGNVKPYLVSEEVESRLADYLMAPIGVDSLIRAWGVQVYASEDYSPGIAASRQSGMRVYRIVLEGYYGAHGETPINTLITHFRKVREAIKNLNLNLSQTVDALTDLGEMQLRRENLASVGEEVFIGRMEGRAEKRSPNW